MMPSPSPSERRGHQVGGDHNNNNNNKFIGARCLCISAIILLLTSNVRYSYHQSARNSRALMSLSLATTGADLDSDYESYFPSLSNHHHNINNQQQQQQQQHQPKENHNSYPSEAMESLVAINGLSPQEIQEVQLQQLRKQELQKIRRKKTKQKVKKFFLIPTPEVTDWLLGMGNDKNRSTFQEAFQYYERSLNEDQAELWLYRSLQKHPSRTLYPNEADVHIICGCLHWNYYLSRQQQRLQRTSTTSTTTTTKRTNKQGTTTTTRSSLKRRDAVEAFNVKEYAETIMTRLVNKTKPHLLAIPTTNPGTSRYIGVKAIIKALMKHGVEDIWSFGFERNKFWQGLPPDRIVPIPYVVRLPPVPPADKINKQKRQQQEIEQAAAAAAAGNNKNSTLTITTGMQFVRSVLSTQEQDGEEADEEDDETTQMPPLPVLWESHSQSTDNRDEEEEEEINKRIDDFVFYSGDKRPHAKAWSGCDRSSMIEPLVGMPNVDVRLTEKQLYKSNGNSKNNRGHLTLTSNRLTQTEYNHRMTTSEYCLILCGDSPTSRSLTSAFVYGCIPLVVGSRLRGLCEKPCRKGWGWTISGIDNPHLPFADKVNWTMFPELDEQKFIYDPQNVLQQELAAQRQQQQQHSNHNNKNTMRTIMSDHREGFIYGWGNPVKSTTFGQAVNYAWDSFLVALERRNSAEAASNSNKQKEREEEEK